MNDNGMTTTVQRMNERLDRLEYIMKSCQLSRTAYPVETNQPLPAQSYINNNNNNNNCLKSNIQCIEIRVQWTVHLGSSHMTINVK